MVTVLPAQIFLAASTAFCAALCADAAPPQIRVAAARIARNGALRRTGNEFPMMSPPYALIIDFAPRAEPPETGAPKSRRIMLNSQREVKRAIGQLIAHAVRALVQGGAASRIGYNRACSQPLHCRTRR